MIIEEFENVKIAYMRRIGEYGKENKKLMEMFKEYLKENRLFDENTVLVGIALDNPAETAATMQRYDVGIIVRDELDYDLPIREIANGEYAIFEVPHTKEDIMHFWKNIQNITANLPVDTSKPIIERYSNYKINSQLCEFCIPLK
ncbi:GyrI-like domain-containing protein [Peptacetobacter hiranonis]|uniref:GyrI-like domain-containing protein n=1 Tax=Peptacetobacter hiranonis TaxID=89152 RepID=UPI002E787018|nr:GyrI-like domain-containing protein [Peptacetobacter hiranonis]MEE0248570.1 GyrI-like domain-containing protein [Peptacetobacter hiranonis]